MLVVGECRCTLRFTSHANDAVFGLDATSCTVPVSCEAARMDSRRDFTTGSYVASWPFEAASARMFTVVGFVRL